MGESTADENARLDELVHGGRKRTYKGLALGTFALAGLCAEEGTKEYFRFSVGQSCDYLGNSLYGYESIRRSSG